MKDRKIVGYKLVFDAYGDEVENQCLTWIEKGWQPFGPCQYAEGGEGSWFYVQTLVKYED